ncbi:MAG TPA: methyl-accepting chemotaxis protein [Rhodocyclaceae bacterium]
MSTWHEIYEQVEKTFWNTLGKKLSSILLLFLADLAYVGFYLNLRGEIRDGLPRGDAAGSFVMSRLDAGLAVLAALTVASLAWHLLQFLYLRHLIVRPVKAITQIFDELGHGEGDFSRDLPLQTHDELRDMAERYNGFAAKMRQIIGDVRHSSVSIARDAAQVKVRLDDTTRTVRSQGELTELVFTASAQATQAIEEVSRSTQLIADSTHANLGTARVSLQEMQEISARINTVSEKVLHFNHTVDDLSRRSESVNQFAALIRDVAEQTNLLALNAAIEAARAGDAGRGFSVVADEVRKLAERVNAATSEIAGNAGAMLTQVKNTRAENEEISADVQRTREVVERSATQFRGMVTDFERTDEQLLHIAAAMEQLSATNGQVHENVNRIHALSTEVAGHMEDSGQRTAALSLSTEAVQELISRFTIGHGAFDAVVARTRRFRDEIRRELDDMAKKGIDVFDKRYQPFGNHQPPKYRVAWDEEFTRRCQPLLEECLKDVPGCAYAVGVNSDGYLSCHNLKFSKPLTGDPAVDLVGNRCHRKFDNPGELRAAKNAEPLLIRTYLRDTGEILCDLAMPIEIGGRLWGNVRVGTTAEALLEDS